MLAVGQETLGIEDKGMIRAMDAFGGGLGSHGEVCGAIIGGLAVIGMAFGRSAPEGEKDRRMRICSDMLMQRFKDEVANGKILCRDITQTDWRDPDQAKRFLESGKRQECQLLTGRTARIVGELLEQSRAMK
ncbi:MAG: C-GCAxxG-C-C family protein [Syntrophales bacterium]